MKFTLREERYTFLIIYRSFLLRMRYISDRSCREYQNTRFLFNTFSPPENHAFYEVMCRNIIWEQL